jgi:hypothetical protein
VYAGYNKTFVGDATGRKRYEEAIKNGLQIKKYALPPGVRPGGHGGSHGYLGDDFIDAILRERRPAVDVIDALNMTVPGYYAHLTALKDGETLRVPQYSLQVLSRQGDSPRSPGRRAYPRRQTLDAVCH